MTDEPFTVSIKRAAELTGLSTRTIHRLKNAALIEVRYYGDKPLVVWESLKNYIGSLPDERDP